MGLPVEAEKDASLAGQLDSARLERDHLKALAEGNF